MGPVLDRDRLVPIGRVLDAHGVRGALKVRPLTETPEYYETCGALYIDSEEGLRHHQVTAFRFQHDHWILAVAGVGDRSAAESLRGAEVLLEEEALRPLEPGEYFHHDLIGCAVETMEGQPLGRVREVMAQGPQDLLVVSDGAREVLLPLMAAIVREVDPARRTIRVAPPPGLLELNG